MLTAELVKAAVYTLLREKFPESEIYLDMLPASFMRPSFFLEQMDITARDVNFNTTEEVSKLAVYCFVSLDDYGNSLENDLSLVGDAVRGLFRWGVIYAEDRAVRCAVLSKKDADMVRVEITATYWEQRSEPEAFPTMGSVEIREETK